MKILFVLQIQNTQTVSSLKANERQFWEQLVESNIRAGTLACLWCLKAQSLKKLGSAFNKWRVFPAIQAYTAKQEELLLLKEREKQLVVDEAVEVLEKYQPSSTSLTMTHNNTTTNNLLSRMMNGGSISDNTTINFPWLQRRQQEEEEEQQQQQTVNHITTGQATNTIPATKEELFFKNHQYEQRDLHLLDQETNTFAELSSQLLDHDLDTETKRKILCK
jgi:phosphopantetheinyl transferase (holo-ACP synthase)